ncbi:hypothetical protein [Halodesulfovibrio aestuarii]|uniref:Uncharacterized protein n=1 Tax=Halodesulfovibrio aestuarii TaxID=126333 RepID=A0A8G2C7C4_9BACT|nr:hypothetical protein [Halodesulfovibrio aestuarii]SHI61148.1 hypothetical protein SAMN05660830_00452 [Halodesulfovibrio aestuarii]
MSRIYGIELSIQIGSYLFNRAPRCIITYDRHTVLSRAEIHVPNHVFGAAENTLSSLSQFQEVSIEVGYRNQKPHKWAGAVDGWKQGQGNKRDQLIIYAAGVELPLVQKTIREMWVDEPASAIAKRILEASGLTVGVVDVPQEIIPRMTLATVPLWQAMQQLSNTLQQGHGRKMADHALWVDEAKLVNFAPCDHWQDTTPVIATGAGLIRHTPSQTVSGRSEVETFLLPTMRAGMRFTLKDSCKGIAGTFRALRVTHSVKPNKARTVLSYNET